MKPTKPVVKAKETNKPIKNFRAGNVGASIWEKKVVKDGKELTFYNVTITKSYKDEKDEWAHTNNYSKQDLQKLVLVGQKAQEFLYLTEQEDSE